MLEYHWLFALFLRSAGRFTGAEGKGTVDLSCHHLQTLELFSLNEILGGSSSEKGRAALAKRGECEVLSWDTPSHYSQRGLTGLKTIG